MTMTVLVTGANRGLGLEMVRQLGESGERVIATARDRAQALDLQELAATLARRGCKVRIENLDVASDDSVLLLADRLAGEPIDVLINNAGIGGDRRPLFEQEIDNYRQCFEVNSLGPLRTTLALCGSLRAGSVKKIVNVSSQLGSMTLNTAGGYHPYRVSKAALNMVSRTLAAELAREGFVCVAFHPGWARTDMGGPQAPVSAKESVGGLLRLIGRLGKADNGKFYDWNGQELPW